MVSYLPVPGPGALEYKVKLDKKVIGAIYRSPTGYYYRPNGGSGLVGDTFKTVDEVKATL